MKNQEKFEKAFVHFKARYTLKMGGTQTVILPNGKSKYFDDRKYYSGKGEKYNNPQMHHIIGEVKISRKDYSNFLKKLKETEIDLANYRKGIEEKKERIIEAKAKGLYSLKKFEDWEDFNVELSPEEEQQKTFDPERLAKTLDISVKDALLLRSPGKTYVFAKQSDGNIIKLYHPSLSCNDLNICVNMNGKKQFSEFTKRRATWTSAPYAGLVGQTKNNNHFVC